VPRMVLFRLAGWVLEAVKRSLRWQAGAARCVVDVNGERWVYLEAGKGEVILLVHGFGMEKDSWDPFLKTLTESYRVIVPDLPGFGETGGSESKSYDVPHQVAWLDRFTRTLRLHSFHLVGISMGGGIAAYYATEHPDKAKSLFLMAPAGVRSREPGDAWRRYQDKGENILLYENADQFDRLLDMLFYRKFFLPKFLKKYFARRGAMNYRLRAKILKDLEVGGIDILEDRLHRVQAPTLVLWGEDDRILHVSGSEKFQKGLPNGHIILLEKCGHVVFLDQPAATRGAYHRFMRKLAQNGLNRMKDSLVTKNE
jgi:abhydrolase domain-containing protein 6